MSGRGSARRTSRTGALLAAALVVALASSGVGSAAGATPERRAVPTAVAGNHLARVTWASPADPPQLYVVSIHEADGTEIDSLVVPATDTTMTVAPLVNGQTYRFRVGGSADESLSNPVTPTDVCTITGTRYADRLVGTSGDDAICGLGGDDHMFGLGGGDSYVGGPGHDSVDYASEPGEVRAFLDLGSPLYPGLGYADFASSLDTEAIVAESLWGSRFADELRGTPRRNTLLGGAGDDVLGNPFGSSMAGGPDVLIGGAGDDRMPGVLTEVGYYGGPGVDAVDLRFAPRPARVDVAERTVEGRRVVGVVRTVEVVHGTGFDDVLLGDAESNLLRGFSGHDTLAGRRGDDRLHGESGDDLLRGQDGADRCFGGGGTDTVLTCESMSGLR